MSTAADPSLLVLWWPIAGAFVVSIITIGLAFAMGKKHLSAPVSAGPAWSSSDSWATNISVLGGIIGTAAGATGGLQQYLPKDSTSGFVALTLLFGGAASLAPIVYAAFAKSTGIASGGGVVSTVGTVAGLCIAAIVTLFAAQGELFLGIELARHSTTLTLGEVAFIIPLALGAIIVCVYSYRSISQLITYVPPQTEPAAGDSVKSPSLLSLSTKASATL